jgi:carboxylesterase
MEWNQPIYREAAGEDGQTGVLVIHGFSGSPRSLQELAGRLVEAGYTVALPLLTGHGLTPGAMEKAAWTDWTADVERAYMWTEQRSDRVFVCGLSVGGALAAWLAAQHPEIAGLVTVNALIRHPQEPLMRLVGRIGFPRWVKAVGNDIKKEGEDERAYERIPARSARQLALLLAVVRESLPLVRCPALVFSSAIDHVVPPQNQQELYDKIESREKTIIRLADSYHVATMDIDKETIFSETLEFIAKHVHEAMR